LLDGKIRAFVAASPTLSDLHMHLFPNPSSQPFQKNMPLGTSAASFGDIERADARQGNLWLRMFFVVLFRTEARLCGVSMTS
jgi:hypothetical protein